MISARESSEEMVKYCQCIYNLVKDRPIAALREKQMNSQVNRFSKEQDL